MPGRTTAGLLIALGVVLLARAARAGAADAAGELPPFGWRPGPADDPALTATRQAGETKLEAARRELVEELSNNLRESQATRAAFLLAAADLGDAAQREPDDGLAQFELGQALAGAERYEEAAGAFERALVLLPVGAGDRMACESDDVALAFDHLGAFDRAIGYYDRCEPYAALDRTLEGLRAYATNRGNSAEGAMARGDLREAIRRYGRAIAVDPSEPLHYYGLAVALDRDGQAAKAREAMRQAFALDPPPYAAGGPRGPVPLWSITSRAGVFFVPQGDAAYYVGLGDEAQGDLRGAAQAFARFLTQTPASRYHGQARAHLKLLERALGEPADAALEAVAAGGIIEFPAVDAGGPDPMAIALRLNDPETRERLQACVEADSVPPRGALSVRFTVGRDGRPSGVTTSGVPTDQLGLAACVARETGALRMPAPPQPYGAAFAITFVRPGTTGIRKGSGL